MKWSKGHRSSVWLFHSSHKGLHPFFTKGTYKLHKASQWFSNDLSVIDPFKLARCLGILIVWPEPLMQGGDDTAGKEQEGQPRCGDGNESTQVEKVALWLW